MPLPVLPCFGNELPFVGACFERELQDAEGSGVAYFTVGLHLAEGAMTLATRADHKFTDAPSRIGGAVGRLRSETLVVVIVTVDNHVGVGIGESLPERLHRQVIAMRAAGTEKRLVAVSERAGGGMRGQIRAQPFFLRRTEFAATNVLAFAVQDNDVPGAEFVAVIAGLWIAGGGAKIIEIRCGPRGMKLVVAWCGPGAGFCSAPGFVIARKILAAAGVGEVAGGHDGAGDLVEQFCGCLGTGKILAVGDVTSTNEDGHLICGWRAARGIGAIRAGHKDCSDEKNRCNACRLHANLTIH